LISSLIFFNTPAKLANAARTRNHVSQLRVRDKRPLQGGILIVRQNSCTNFVKSFVSTNVTLTIIRH